MSKTRGDHAEKIAVEFLKKNKFRVVQNNYHCRWGEIDIIARYNDILAFTEVRYRKTNCYGHAWETVNTAKQQRIIKTAQTFLLENSKYEEFCLRFDLISLDGDLNDPDIEWFQNAFTL